MLPPLSVSEVRAVILVYCEAESALKGADVIFEEVRIFFKVDGFKSKLA